MLSKEQRIQKRVVANRSDLVFNFRSVRYLPNLIHSKMLRESTSLTKLKVKSESKEAVSLIKI
jgi:hypothetical protein